MYIAELTPKKETKNAAPVLDKPRRQGVPDGTDPPAAPAAWNACVSMLRHRGARRPLLCADRRAQSNSARDRPPAQLSSRGNRTRGSWTIGTKRVIPMHRAGGGGGGGGGAGAGAEGPAGTGRK